jgi:glycosyltransferase involved in cell wall biosynthesis
MQLLLAQGGANPHRALNQLVRAVLAVKDLRLIVVGPYRPEQIATLEQIHGQEIHDRVYFTGYIDQLHLTPFIDNAAASVVLYESIDMNNHLCAPNRMYQAIGRGTPVLVGANPPMKNLVTKLQTGVVLTTDGHDSGDVENGIRTLLQQLPELKLHSQVHQEDLVWESQRDLMVPLLY